MEDYQSYISQLREELLSFGIACSEDQAALLLRHLSLVIEKNKVMNLTRIVDPVSAVTLHLVDSLLPLASAAFELHENQSFVDIGTGAGYPGIPFGIMTGAEGILVDSVGKKVSAVNEFIDVLGLSSLRAVHTRVESVSSVASHRVDLVVARAVAQTNVLMEYATPLLHHDGLLVLEKANPSLDELSHASSAAKICGLSNVSCETYELPHSLGHRTVLIYKKTGNPRIKLPRSIGEAKRHPLGE